MRRRTHQEHALSRAVFPTKYVSQTPFPESDALSLRARRRSYDRGGGPSEEATTFEISSVRQSVF